MGGGRKELRGKRMRERYLNHAKDGNKDRGEGEDKGRTRPVWAQELGQLEKMNRGRVVLKEQERYLAEESNKYSR